MQMVASDTDEGCSTAFVMKTLWLPAALAVASASCALIRHCLSYTRLASGRFCPKYSPSHEAWAIMQADFAYHM